MKRKLPNIVLIVLDTLGAKHMSLYGYHRQTTPNLERIAEECRVYTRCFATSCWTMPSHASMFTGLFPSQHGVYEGNYLLSNNVRHLVPALKMAGYDTYGISSNRLVTPGSGLCPGFDFFKSYGENWLETWLENLSQSLLGTEKLSARLASVRGKKAALHAMMKYLMESGDVMSPLVKVARYLVSCAFNPTKGSAKYSEATARLFCSEIDKGYQDDKSFFLFINIMEAHQLYKPPLKWRQYSQWHDKQHLSTIYFYEQTNTKYNNNLLFKYNNLYDDEISYIDDILKRIWKYFKRSSIFEDTLFIITSDHGEHFGEKGRYAHLLSLYNELIWVPLLIRYPNWMEQTGADDRLVSLTDLFSTILDAARIPLPSPETSISLLGSTKREFTLAQIVNPEIWPGSNNRKQTLKLGFSPPIMALITDSGVKIIEGRNGSMEIYQLSKDMFENNNLAKQLPEAVLDNYREMLDFVKKDTGFPDYKGENV